MGRFLATNGELGECPDWYPLVQAAKYLNVAPWLLMEQSDFWQSKALVALAGEASARKTLENRL